MQLTTSFAKLLVTVTAVITLLPQSALAAPPIFGQGSGPGCHFVCPAGSPGSIVGGSSPIGGGGGIPAPSATVSHISPAQINGIIASVAASLDLPLPTGTQSFAPGQVSSILGEVNSVLGPVLSALDIALPTSLPHISVPTGSIALPTGTGGLSIPTGAPGVGSPSLPVTTPTASPFTVSLGDISPSGVESIIQSIAASLSLTLPPLPTGTQALGLGNGNGNGNVGDELRTIIADVNAALASLGINIALPTTFHFGTGALPTGSLALPTGSVALPSGSVALPSGSVALPSGNGGGISVSASATISPGIANADATATILRRATTNALLLNCPQAAATCVYSLLTGRLVQSNGNCANFLTETCNV